MTVRVSSVQTVKLPGEGAYLARVDMAADEVWIYPQGLGQGPAIAMSRADWVRINREVRLAFMRAEGKVPE